MSLSRKRRRELKKLRKLTRRLLEEQREVLGHAGSVLGEAGQQARKLGDEHLMPHIEGAYDRVRPGVEVGVDVARGVGSSIRKATAPVIAALLARTISVLRNSDNKKAAKRVEKYAKDHGLIKRKRGLGATIALLVGGIAAAAIGYSLWQAFRDDDELWVAPETDSLNSNN